MEELHQMMLQPAKLKFYKDIEQLHQTVMMKWSKAL